MVQDLKYALRLWAARPWQAALAIAALAIGIGANTGVFSVLNALLLRSLPFREPDRLALLHQFIPPHDSAKQFHEWRQQSAYLADAALYEERDVNLGGVRVGTRAHVAQTSWSFFSVLGTQPVLGSGFSANEDVDGTGWGPPGRNAVVVLVTDYGNNFSTATLKFWALQSVSTEFRLPSSVLRRRASIIPAKRFSGSREYSALAIMDGRPSRA